MSAVLPTPGVTPRPDGAPDGAAAETGAPLEWTFNPWRQSLSRAVLGASALLGILALMPLLGLPPLAAAALIAVFASEFSQVIFPARCRVDDQGVARRLAFFWERRPWDRIRKARVGRQGLFVSSHLRPAVLVSFGGMMLPFSPAAPPTLVGELRLRLAQHGL